MFCASVNCSSSTTRSLTMPNRSTVASQSALSAMSLVARPDRRIGALLGQRRARHQVHEHLGHRLIDAGDADALAGLNDEALKP